MTTLVCYPAAGTDDSFQDTSQAQYPSNSTGVFLSSSRPYAASRFVNVTVPGGATVSSSSISLYGAISKSVTLSSAVIDGVKQANPATFASTTNYIGSLLSTYPTTNTYSWTATLSTSAYVASGDISAIITELIGQSGWASGNAMAFIYSYGSSNANWRNYTLGSNYPELTITYTSGGGSTFVATPLTVISQAVNRASRY